MIRKTKGHGDYSTVELLNVDNRCGLLWVILHEPVSYRLILRFSTRTVLHTTLSQLHIVLHQKLS